MLLAARLIPVGAVRHGETRNPGYGDTYSEIHNLTGWPAVVVRAGCVPRLLLPSFRSIERQSAKPAEVVILVDPTTPAAALDWIEAISAARGFVLVRSQSPSPGNSCRWLRSVWSGRGPGSVGRASCSPTRRSRVMLGKTLASAERTASIRGVMVAIPWLTLPAIDPEASNTSMESSMQGLRSESSACARMGADKIAAMPSAAGKDR